MILVYTPAYPRRYGGNARPALTSAGHFPMAIRLHGSANLFAAEFRALVGPFARPAVVGEAVARFRSGAVGVGHASPVAIHMKGVAYLFAAILRAHVHPFARAGVVRIAMAGVGRGSPISRVS